MYSSIIDGTPTTFGTSGMLYRSNKLMYDRLTKTVWNHLGGVPAWGPLAGTDIKLKIFPASLTTWGEWQAEHPETTVLALETGVYPARSYLPEENPNAIYFDYFNSADTMFPVWQQDDSLHTRDVVLALSIGGEDRAYPIAVLQRERVVNDELGGSDLVVLGSPDSQAAAAYLSDGRTFSLSDDESNALPTALIDSDGILWEVTNEYLINSKNSSQKLSRLPAQTVFWFGWVGFHPETSIYSGK